jgi:hypothetical protein
VTIPLGAWRAWLSEEPRAAIMKAAEEAHPRETGGVLVGVVAERRGATRPWVTHAVEVRSRKSGWAHYELPAGARERAVKGLRKFDPRVGYLGDWHSHPMDVGPSCTDAISIASISGTGDCPRPLLFVIRHMSEGYDIDARQWTGASLRHLNVMEAGPLPLQERPPRRRPFPKMRVRR